MLAWLRHRFLLVQQLLFAGLHTLLRRFTEETCTTETTAGLASSMYLVSHMQLLASYREAAGSVEHLLFCRLSSRGLTRHLTMLTTSLLS